MSLYNVSADETEDSYRSAVWLWRIISPIFIIFGTFGNILTILVLTWNKSRITSTTVYLSALAISDLLALNTGMLRQWVTHSFNVDIRLDLSEVGCRLHFFTVYVVTQFSSWMLVCVTVERFLSTWLPHRRNITCTTKFAGAMVFTIATALVMLNAHYLFGYGNVEIHNGNETIILKCVPRGEPYEHFIMFEWTWIDLCVFYLIPMVVLVSGNSAIVYKVIQSHHKSRRIVPVITTNNVSTISTIPPRVNQTSGKTSSLTTTLVVVSAVFIVCITPIVVIPIGEPHWKAGASPEKLADLFWWDTVANIFMYASNAINFVLYFLSGSKFRNEVRRLLCGKCIKYDPPGSLPPTRSGTMLQRSHA